ncbi:Ig-like domain-containing protein, partial [Flavobacterium sp.]|uniref:Ig-like domain-containing protein n=1 Tax=Flavobacterium sp. TaxID=239 RepID=UPI0038FD2FD4
MTKIKYLFLAFQFLTAFSSYSQQSALVYPDTNGKLVYAKYANNYETNEDNTLPDFSYVGYMDGAVGVPVREVPVKITLNPNPSGEDRTRIQEAIDQVCNMPLDANGFRGAVLLKKGTYRLNDETIPVLTDGMGYALRIWASGVVLRGEGQGTDGTILYSDFAKNHTMITLEPYSQTTPETTMTLITDAYVGTGAKTFTVANASSFAVGDNIMVKFTPNATWFSDLKVDENGYILYVAPPAESDYWNATAGAFNIGFKRKIMAINGNTITIDCSVMQPMQTKYGGGQIKKYTTTGRLNKCGVEDLRIVGIEDGGIPSDKLVNGNRLRVGIRPRFLDNSWIHGVTVTRTSESAIMTWGVMNVTVQECAYIDPRGPITGGWRYSFSLDAGSTRVLFQRCYSDYGRHDFVTHARIPGPNVFVDCYSANGQSVLGPHYRWATGTLFDNIKAPNSVMAINLFDLSNGHAWCGAQTVGWNLECKGYVNDASRGSQNFLIGSIGTEYSATFSPTKYPDFIFRGYWEKSGPAGVHVSTRSLYFKQLEDRLGSQAVSNITIPEQRTGNIYTKLAAWAGNGSLVNIPVTGITLTPTSLTLSVGSSQQLAATIAPENASNKNITWTSNNTSVTTVSATGMVTAVSVGTATITVTTEDGGKTATTEITTTNQIFVSSVAVSPTTATIAMGNQQQLTATILPANASNKNMTWTSSNPNVANVSSLGLVTSVAQGTCDITVTTQDGDQKSIAAITVGPYPESKIISNCDSNTDWTSASTVTVNSTDEKEGTGCLQSVGAIGTVTADFKKVFSPPINTGSTIANGKLQFWYFVSDINAYRDINANSTANQVELGSGGAFDKFEFSWNI